MDFIPLTITRKSRRNSGRKNTTNYIGDQNLLQRVRDYLQTEGNEMVDIEKMADHLQGQYRDYVRKKKNPFRLEVEKVFERIVNESRMVKRSNRTADVPSPDFSSDNENYVEVSDNNMINKNISVKKSTVTFSDMAGCDSTITDICNLICHLKHPELYSKFGIKPPRGILLHGPPGCGKTMLANAIAGELDLPLIQITSTELVAGISGESEERIRDVFDKAVSIAPSVLFIDEIDAVIRKRESAEKGMEVRVVTQLAACMDDLNNQDAKSQVLVVATANYPDTMDQSLRRGGRFDHEVNVPIPNEEARMKLLNVLCKTINLDPDMDFKKVLESSKCNMEIDSDTREARKLNAIARLHSDSLFSSEETDRLCVMKLRDFENALKIVQPSLKREGFTTIPDVTYDDIGALKDTWKELRLALTAPLHHADICDKLGILKTAGILLYGPPGCGKTLLAKAIANESGLNFISVKGPELLNMYLGESERAIRMCFQRAQNAAPCVIFFDEFDALCPKRSGSSNHESSTRLVTQLLTEMDGFGQRGSVLIIAATNRPDALDKAVLRPNRLGNHFYVGLPTSQARVEILQTITKNGTLPPLANDVDLTTIGLDERCHGFTGADLSALVQEAAKSALAEIIDEVKGAAILVTKKHFEVAFQKVWPSVSTEDQQMYDEMRNFLKRGKAK
uniref:AAA+ ATPase domain-containing protein n=1 Tax=Strigamia maritima TaxID=126957 RepID=T1JFM4_STRMM